MLGWWSNWGVGGNMQSFPERRQSILRQYLETSFFTLKLRSELQKLKDVPIEDIILISYLVSQGNPLLQQEILTILLGKHSPHKNFANPDTIHKIRTHIASFMEKSTTHRAMNRGVVVEDLNTLVDILNGIHKQRPLMSAHTIRIIFLSVLNTDLSYLKRLNPLAKPRGMRKYGSSFALDFLQEKYTYEKQPVQAVLQSLFLSALDSDTDEDDYFIKTAKLRLKIPYNSTVVFDKKTLKTLIQEILDKDTQSRL